MTILEAITLSTDFLSAKGIKSARLNAELLLAHILNIERIQLYLKYDKPLNDNEVSQYREMLKRRVKFEPLQYIIGKVEFYGLTFKVNENVLIPRPESEILIETVLDSVDKKSALSILDIGTGSGNLSISLAKNLPAAQILAIDIDDSIISLACENARINNVLDQIKFLNLNIKNGAEFKEKFDVVVSNPPYVSLKEFDDLQPEIKYFEPRKAVTDDEDGLSFYKKILGMRKNLFNRGGKLFFEIALGQYAAVCGLMEEFNFKNIRVRKDYSGIERVISGAAP